MDPQQATISDHVRYDGFADDLACAMDLWNRGRYDEAVPLLRKLAEAGDATCQYDLGICIRDELGGLHEEPERVLWWWAEAAKQGHVVAMYNIGLCLETGYGAPAPEPEAALEWYGRAAAEHFPLAIERLRALDSQHERSV